MSAIDSILMELEQEGATTARVLERVPEQHLAWKPHEKSMSLGQLALHIAGTPGFIADMAAVDAYQMSAAELGNPPQAGSSAEIMQAHAKSIAHAKEFLSGLSPDQLGGTCRLMMGPQQLMAMPRGVLIRAIMLNHWIHHRGQLSVYLRLLDVPVPSIYGPSADENPFAGK